ncbi:hypothetical protein K493DRAFT_354262 [Basidiobolus meristosporus CBS 931.73]|uniref:Uncharacterized protein n=1 Tax=Basidiobolus meristosporus CBS 931.73 TaxID=1314790 RepID=A0A1Y1Y4H1_9FUNG|nr:hypothetical protein K493DRAFT_354262 [Basidiobolus meristosporus CBS 931.73]|eukprot:ORX92616.1 hypothetical protein K493DRAFT_354262 [Basidiobolus meristosporus CBS 931.73]
MENFLSLPLQIVEDILAHSESLAAWTLVSKELYQLVYTSTGLKATWLRRSYIRAKKKFPSDSAFCLDRNNSGYEEDLDDMSNADLMIDELAAEQDAELLFLYWRQPIRTQKTTLSIRYRTRIQRSNSANVETEGDMDALEWMLQRSLNKCDIWDGNFCGFMRALGISLSKGAHRSIRLILGTLACSNGLPSFGLHRWVMYPTREQSLNPEPWKSILRQVCFCSADIDTFEFAIGLCAEISQVDKRVWREQAFLCCSKYFPRYITRTLVEHLLSGGVDPNVSEGLAMWYVGSSFMNEEHFEYEIRTFAAIPIDDPIVNGEVYLDFANSLITRGLRITEKLIGNFVTENYRRFLQILHAKHNLPLTTQSKSLLSVALDAHIISTNMIRFLLASGVAVDPNHFLLGVTKGRLDIVELLFNGLHDIQPATMAHALEIAVKCMHLEIVNFLLEHGASLENLLKEFCISYPKDGSYLEIKWIVKFQDDHIQVDLASKKWSLQTPRDDVFLEILKTLGTTWSKLQNIPRVTLLFCSEGKAEPQNVIKKVVLS